MSNPNNLPHEERRATTLAWLGGSVMVALLVRLALWLGYSSVPYSDTPSYRRLAESVLNGFTLYDGTRTPGYPAFLALVGGDSQVWMSQVWLVQMAMGMLITLALYYFGWQLSGRGWFGALAALAHTLNLGQLFFEANLLTETLTTFYLAMLYVGYFWLLSRESRPRWGLALGVGLATSLALLTRPLFIFLPVWVGLFITWRISARYPPSAHPENGKARWPVFKIIQAYFLTRLGLARLAAFALPVLLLVGGWVLFIHQRFGDWGLTTMTGYHLVQHTGGYFEYVPDEYAALRDTYIQFRDAKIAATGTQTNAIWEAIPELSRVTGLNFYDLSRTMARISMHLILEHPDLFLKNVLQGWWMFWRAPVYWAPEALQNPEPAKAIAGLVLLQRAVLLVINLTFVAGSLTWAAASYLPSQLIERLPRLFQRLRAAFLQRSPGDLTSQVHQRFMLCLASTIWITSIVQSLLDHGDNPRFLLPLQSFVVLWVAWFWLKILHRPDRVF